MQNERTATTPERKRITRTPIENGTVLSEAYEYSKKVSFSRGLRVELGDVTMLFISGTASVNEKGESIHAGDFQAQTQRTFNNITGLLESENADWHDVVRTTCYLADFRHYDEFNEVRNTFFEQQQLDPLPASTCIEARICRPELLVEIEAIAVIPRDRPVGSSGRPAGSPGRPAGSPGRPVGSPGRPAGS
jgi:enamine deaminase RidA (YjgF/YER057c/UK114 family)